MASRPGPRADAPETMPVIAILDDDDAFRDALAGGIAAIGHAVTALATAEALFDLLAMMQPACLLLDYNLPGRNGLDLQRELITKAPALPIVFISACRDQAVIDAALAARAVAYLAKPVHLDDLEPILAALIPAAGESARGTPPEHVTLV